MVNILNALIKLIDEYALWAVAWHHRGFNTGFSAVNTSKPPGKGIKARRINKIR
jgi:hypothetical protein